MSPLVMEGQLVSLICVGPQSLNHTQQATVPYVELGPILCGNGHP